MNRCFGWAMLIAAGMVLGWAFSTYEKTNAAQPAMMDADVEDQNSEVVEQLKEINVHLKKIDTLLDSGTLRVVNVLNPGAR